MLIKIACACGHIGIASAQSLPRDPDGSRCGETRRLRAEDASPVRSRVAFEEWLFGEREASR
jgi:hypothetical protein